MLAVMTTGSSTLPLPQRFELWARLTRLDKPIGVLLLLWPTLTALWLAAGGLPPLSILAIFVAGTFLMRSAGCAVNDVADREFDRHVQRTQTRVVNSGLVSPREALMVALVLALAAGLLVLPLNVLTWKLSVLALAIAAAYPFFKRFFAVPQAFLGIAFSFGIPMAFAAVRGDVPLAAWGLMLANLFWVVAYDTEYALVDIADDRRIGIRTSAITFGGAVVPITMACYCVFLAGMVALGFAFERHAFYWTGLAVATVLALYHGWLIRRREPAACFRAFLNNHWLGAAIFAGVVFDHVAFG
ncbi:4-hydroxybenzoate octaprenyltransferase [soil metagenome]